MTEQLCKAEERYEQLCRDLERPEVFSDSDACARVNREIRTLTPVVETWRRLRAAQERARQAELLLTTETDPELRALCDEDRREAQKEAQALQGELTVLLLPHDPNDEKNVIVEIRAGAGGEEAALFAADLYRMYTMYAASQGFRTEVVGVNETGLGGYKEITFTVEGEGAYSRLKFESGVHRVQRVPETESGGRIHTSTVTVAVLPEADEVEVEILPSDLQIETIKSSGAGGQHVNKTESAVRLIHIPTGMVVECQDERSQYKNRDRAMKILRSRLLERKRAEQESAIASERRSQVGSGDRSERIRTYNFPQGRVTDHRIGLTIHAIENFLNGDIGPMLSALAASDTAKRLGEGSAEGNINGNPNTEEDL